METHIHYSCDKKSQSSGAAELSVIPLYSNEVLQVTTLQTI